MVVTPLAIAVQCGERTRSKVKVLVQLVFPENRSKINTTAHAQCYYFLSILCNMQYYNSGLMQLEQSRGRRKGKIINYFGIFSN